MNILELQFHYLTDKGLLMEYQEAINLIENDVYLHLGAVGGIDYYSSNDEDLRSLIVVDHSNQLAVKTAYRELEDFLPFIVDGKKCDSDYMFINYEGRLISNFERPGFYN